MNCPHCHEPIDPASIPDAEIKFERARRNGARAQNSGRRPVPTECPKCGETSPSAREARKHKCKNTK